MGSPKSRKYNEAGGDPWKYIYPALRWIEEYESVWKPKHAPARNVSVGKTLTKTKTKSLDNSTKKTMVPSMTNNTMFEDMKIVLQKLNGDIKKEKFFSEEQSNPSSDNSTDEEDIHSLGFTTANSTDISRDYNEVSKIL